MTAVLSPIEVSNITIEKEYSSSDLTLQTSSETDILEQVKSILADFCKSHLAMGNKKDARVEELTLNGTTVHFKVWIRSKHKPIPQITAYSFTYNLEGDIDLINPLDSLRQVEMCINAPRPVNKICCTAEDIASILLPLI